MYFNINNLKKRVICVCVCVCKFRYTDILHEIIPYCVWTNFVATYYCCFPSSFYNCWLHADNNTCLALPTKIANLLMGCKCLSDKKILLSIHMSPLRILVAMWIKTIKFLLSKIYFTFIQRPRLHMIFYYYNVLEVSFISRKIIYLKLKAVITFSIILFFINAIIYHKKKIMNLIILILLDVWLVRCILGGLDFNGKGFFFANYG